LTETPTQPHTAFGHFFFWKPENPTQKKKLHTHTFIYKYRYSVPETQNRKKNPKKKREGREAKESGPGGGGIPPQGSPFEGQGSSLYFPKYPIGYMAHCQAFFASFLGQRVKEIKDSRVYLTRITRRIRICKKETRKLVISFGIFLLGFLSSYNYF